MVIIYFNMLYNFSVCIFMGVSYIFVKIIGYNFDLIYGCRRIEVLKYEVYL